MRALSIRQPFAELILRGIKTIEFRSRPTRIIGERFFIYAARGTKARRHQGTKAEEAFRIWSNDLAVTTPRHGEHPPDWLMELAEELILGKLPTGVIVGSAMIAKVRPHPMSDLFEWHLTGVERIARPRKPIGHPQPVWFDPF